MRSNWGDDSYGRSGGFGMQFSLNGIPVVRGVLIATVVAFLAYFFTHTTSFSLPEWLGFHVSLWYLQPWTWITYPIMETGPIGLLLNGYWFFVVGGVLERSWGSRNFAALLAIFSVIGALGFVPALYLFRTSNVFLGGLFLTNSALTVAWAASDPEMMICFWGVSLKLKHLALLDVLFVYIFTGFIPGIGPLAAVCTFVAPAAAWFYVRKLPRLNIGFRAPRTEPRRAQFLREDVPAEREKVGGFNPLRKRREQEEIERLRKLLGDDDDDRPVRRN